MDQIDTLFSQYKEDLRSCVAGTPYEDEASSLTSDGPRSVHCTIRYTRESNNLEVESSSPLPSTCILVIPCACVYVYFENGTLSDEPRLKCLVNILSLKTKLAELIDKLNAEVDSYSSTLTPEIMKKLNDAELGIGGLFTHMKVNENGKISGFIGGNTPSTVSQKVGATNNLEIKLTAHPTKSDLNAVIGAYKYIKNKVVALCAQSGVCANPYAAGCGVGDYTLFGSEKEMWASCSNLLTAGNDTAYTPLITLIDLFFSFNGGSYNTVDFLCTKGFFNIMKSLINHGKELINTLGDIDVDALEKKCKKPTVGAPCTPGTTLYDPTSVDYEKNCLKSVVSQAFIVETLFGEKLKSFVEDVLDACPTDTKKVTLNDLIDYVPLACLLTDVNDKMVWHSDTCNMTGNGYTAYIPGYDPIKGREIEVTHCENIENGEEKSEDLEGCTSGAAWLSEYTVYECGDDSTVQEKHLECWESSDECGDYAWDHTCPKLSKPNLASTTVQTQSKTCKCSKPYFSGIESCYTLRPGQNGGILHQFGRGITGCTCNDPLSYNYNIIGSSGVYAHYDVIC